MLTRDELREKLWKLRTEKFSVCNFIITDIMAHDAEQRARIAELEAENAKLESAITKAVSMIDYINLGCPISELAITGAYPASCEVSCSEDGEDFHCAHSKNWDTEECWMKYLLGEMELMELEEDK